MKNKQEIWGNGKTRWRKYIEPGVGLRNKSQATNLNELFHQGQGEHGKIQDLQDKYELIVEGKHNFGYWNWGKVLL